MNWLGDLKRWSGPCLTWCHVQYRWCSDHKEIIGTPFPMLSKTTLRCAMHGTESWCHKIATGIWFIRTVELRDMAKCLKWRVHRKVNFPIPSGFKHNSSGKSLLPHLDNPQKRPLTDSLEQQIVRHFNLTDPMTRFFQSNSRIWRTRSKDTVCWSGQGTNSIQRFCRLSPPKY